MREISCHKVASGFASGPALVTKMAISFLGNVDPRTGMVVDPGHELVHDSLGAHLAQGLAALEEHGLAAPTRHAEVRIRCLARAIHHAAKEKRSGPRGHDQPSL